MPVPYRIPLWKASPFVRLLAPLVAGIVFHWYAEPRFIFIYIPAILLILAGITFPLLPIHTRFRFQKIAGLLLNGLIFCFALLLCRYNDVRNDKSWFGHIYNDSTTLIMRITDPPIEKEKSYKAEAVVEEICTGGTTQPASGKLMLYFSKDSTKIPGYGDRILIRGGLERIRNTGNPGGFDYETYMGLQNVFYRGYLQKDDYILLPGSRTEILYRFIFSARKKLLHILQQNIRGDKKVTGVAEAIFIGYKEDLDKDEVQAYRNGGVVHIIIIAGMHLGLISALLVWFFGQFKFLSRLPVLKVILILSCIWLFTLITGASVPVLRSAVMFTCIIIGRYFFRKPNTYNSLAASAFLLLCYDPLLLWDAGFQLSYCAVTGIVWLQKPIAKLWYHPNHVMQKIWELCALSLSAQSLILPLCVYYFHTIPLAFLLTNLLCVPVFSIILSGEILLVTVSAIPFLANAIGKSIYVLTRFMNLVIDACNAIPFSLISDIYATLFTTGALYGFIIFLCQGLMSKDKKLLKVSAAFLTLFMIFCSYGKIRPIHQKKIVIYRVPHATAIDFISGKDYVYAGDTTFDKDLQSSRLFFCEDRRKDSLSPLTHRGKFWQFYDKQLLIIDSAIQFEPLTQPIKTDILLISHNPKVNLANIVTAVNPAVVVIDGSNSLWKIGQLKRECEQLHLRCFITAEQGAYILDADQPLPAAEADLRALSLPAKN